MNRPQMINPVTGKIMNIFSEDFEDLLDQGFTVEELLNIPVLKVSPNIPLTGIPDIDSEILLNIPSYDLRKVCKINKYTEKLCQDKVFWLKRFENANYKLPELHIKNVDWFDLYNAVMSANDILDKTKKQLYEYSMKNTFTVKQLLHLFELSDIPITEEMEEKNSNTIIYDIDIEYKRKYKGERKYRLYINIKDDNGLGIKVTEDQLYKLVIYIEYYNLSDD
jgi:hypothetical protein